MNDRKNSLTLSQSLARITLAGSLCMVFITIISSPLMTEFLRTIGASEVIFGLFGGLPMAMVAMQFAGAVITNHIRKRKPLFMALVITARLLYLAVAFIPIIFPSLERSVVLHLIVVLVTASAALENIASPLFVSWMADLVPRRVLNSYWGRRQLWMYSTWTIAYLCVAAYSFFVRLPVITAFPILATVAVAAGVWDIALFKKIEEPVNVLSRGESVFATMLAPLLHSEYRSIVVFHCVWFASTMFASVFMQLHALKILGLSVWQTTMIFCLGGVGTALFSAQWGRIADRHGHRPVLVICSAFKPVIVLAFFIATPNSAWMILSVAMLLDGIWNAGELVAVNGYMLKMAPRKNRSMFIAAVMGIAGICGGIGAIAGGVFLRETAGFSVSAFGREWTNFHMLFLASIFIRASCVAAALNVREIHSLPPAQLLNKILGSLPELFLVFPVGLYRRFGNPRTR